MQASGYTHIASYVDINIYVHNEVRSKTSGYTHISRFVRRHQGIRTNRGSYADINIMSLVRKRQDIHA